MQIVKEKYGINREDSKIYLILKRMFDFISSLIGLIIFLPILIIIAVAIKLDSKGPIVFGHIRIGKNGQEIKVYKFRSMVQNAQEVFNNFTPEQKAEFNKNFKLENDPRITRVGSFLRKTSLDELPQLWNIIKGDMSVVGPRPIVKKEIIKYGDSFGKVFSVKPGLTGYWQANGRSDTTYDERVDMDLYYVDNRSLGLDFKILIQTFVSVIKKEGAM
ncbi:sugar transferase [Clostridium perfringens]|uniref:sugar transferase n=1 Tax=Clostridium perfringens TaxID=1502 RepID=UPI000AF5967B|nr:sugar transferase [Clostridium perfringens]MCX0404023.1 sugar transferase [Clostridium perfringens]MDK0542028.1 sugar transferase [Clostridium perfringens]MDK0601195.1 sugar transferase [Clostridium perfringens]MDK0604076.1 sugar transferase [Clostridium perfringens]MDK0720978.1 sugar transferase [Clostridium perfringens]